MTARAVPWAKVVAEGTAIVVSILLAFAIQAWWEGRQLRETEREILAGLASDFRANRDQLEFIIGLLEGTQAPLIALDDGDLETLGQVSDSRFDEVGMALQGTPTFDSRDATLDATISSGDLGTICDPRLRDLLAEWRGAVEDLGEEATEFRQASSKAIDRIGLLGGPWVNDPSKTPLAFDPASSEAMAHFRPYDLQAAVSDTELLALLRVKRLRALAYLRFLTPLVPLADSILVQVERTPAGTEE